MTKLHDVSLETLIGGAAPERFDREWSKLLKNIMDPNTDPEAPREVTVKVKVKPNEDRASARIRLEVTAKMAPARPIEAPIHLAERGGKLVAVGYDPRQPSLFEEDQDPEVRPIAPSLNQNQRADDED